MTSIEKISKGKNQKEINELFITACRDGDLDTVQYLLTSPSLEFVAEINSNSGDALFFATINNHIDIVKYLTTSPDLEEKASISKNAFISACAEGRLELIKFFL